MVIDKQDGLRGSCLCGSVKYKVIRFDKQMLHCNCSICRKFHGAAFATLGEANVEDFEWLMGQELLSQHQAENGTVHRFCKDCRLSMTFSTSDDNDDVIKFALGTLDDSIDLQSDANIFVSKS